MTVATLPERKPLPVAAVASVVAVVSGAAGFLWARPVLGLLSVTVVLAAAAAISLRSDWLTVLVVGVIWSNAAVVATRFHQMPRGVGMALPLILLAPLAVRVLVHRQPLVLPPALPWLVAFLAVQLVGTLLAVDRELATDSLYDFILEGLLIYVAVVNVIRTASILRACMWALLAVGGLLGAVSLHQAVTDNFHDNYLGFGQVPERTLDRLSRDTEADVVPRAAGPIGEKNYYAQILITLVPIGLLRARAERAAIVRAAAYALTGLVSAGFVLSSSRGGTIALGLTFAVMFVMGHLRRTHLALAGAGVALVMVLFAAQAERIATIGDIVSGGVEGTDGEADVSVQGRAGEMMAGVRVFADHPVVGVGPDQFPLYYRSEAIEIGLFVHDGTRFAHNLVAQLAAETGILGLLTFGMATGLTLRHLRRAMRRDADGAPGDAQAGLAAALFFALTGYLAAGLFLSLSYERYFWLLLALGAAAAAISSDDEPGRDRGASVS